MEVNETIFRESNMEVNNTIFREASMEVNDTIFREANMEEEEEPEDIGETSGAPFLAEVGRVKVRISVLGFCFLALYLEQKDIFKILLNEHFI